MSELGACFSDYFAEIALKHVFSISTYTPVSTIYMGLHTSVGSDSATGTEISGGGYSRQPVTFNTATDGVLANTNEIQFGPATESWGSSYNWALWDAETGGNYLVRGYVLGDTEVTAGYRVDFGIGDVGFYFYPVEISKYLANKILNLIFNGDSYTAPSTLAIALAGGSVPTSIAWDDTGSTFSELSITGYSRYAISLNDIIMSPAGTQARYDGNKIQGSQLTVPANSSVRLDSMALLDSTTIGTGNILVYDNVIAYTIADKDRFFITSGFEGFNVGID